MLLADHLVDIPQVILDLGAVAVFRDGTTLGHLLDIMLQLARTRPRSLLVADIPASVNGRLGTGGDGHILVDRRDAENLLAVLNELLTQFLGKLVGLTTGGGAVVDMVLHEVEKEGVGTVHEADTLADNFAVDSPESAKDDIIVHAQSILASPVPGRVVHPGLQGVERGLDAGGVKVAMLHLPQVQLGLQCFLTLLRSDEGLVTGPEIHFQIAGDDLELLLE